MPRRAPLEDPTALSRQPERNDGRPKLGVADRLSVHQILAGDQRLGFRHIQPSVGLAGDGADLRAPVQRDVVGDSPPDGGQRQILLDGLDLGLLD